MQIDLEDILAGTFGRIVAAFFFAISAAWVGSVIGGVAVMVGEYCHAPLLLMRELLGVWASPRFLVNIYLIPNLVLLAVAAGVLFATDRLGLVGWGILVAMESLFVMFGLDHHYLSGGEIAAAWSVWLVLLIMAETGIWLIRGMLRNRWARGLAALNAENAMRRAERGSPDLPVRDQP